MNNISIKDIEKYIGSEIEFNNQNDHCGNSIFVGGKLQSVNVGKNGYFVQLKASNDTCNLYMPRTVNFRVTQHEISASSLNELHIGSLIKHKMGYGLLVDYVRTNGDFNDILVCTKFFGKQKVSNLSHNDKVLVAIPSGDDDD